MRSNLDPLLKDRAVRFITLTLKHDDTPLSPKLDRLLDCFDRLRRMSGWASRVTGGAAFIEVKHNDETSRWHPHLHVICTGSYFPHDDLKSLWLSVTGDSHIVDVRLVKDENTIARYVSKYLTKPGDNQLYRNHDALCEAIRALKGRRLVTTFGTWRGTPLLKNETLSEWAPVMPWPELLARCRMNDVDAIAIYRTVTRFEWVADDTDVDDSRAPPF